MATFGFGELPDSGGADVFSAGRKQVGRTDKAPLKPVEPPEAQDPRLKQPRGELPRGSRGQVAQSAMQNLPTSNVPAGANINVPSVDPSKELWVETRSQAGKVYFYSAKTRKTAWTKPTSAQVISQQQFLALALSQSAQTTAKAANPGVPARFAAPVGIPQFLMQMAPSAGKYTFV
mgnify:CR=1 FL=1